MSEAALNNHIEILRYFLEDLKVDINSEYSYDTVFSDSTRSSDFEIIKFLLHNGADINGGKDRLSTPLDNAVRGNRADVVQYLLDNGADADFVGTSDGGYTPSRPLTVAIQNGYFDIVKILVDHGVDLSYTENWTSGKDTPLEIAEREKSQNIIDYIKNALNDK
jgi:ankyrin repeat protein